jgi:hypothetical protein
MHLYGHRTELLTESQRPRLALGLAAVILYSLAVVVFLLEEMLNVETLSRHALPAALLAAACVCGVAAGAWLLGPATRFERLVGWSLAVSAIFAVFVASIWWGADWGATGFAWILAGISGWVSVSLAVWISVWSWLANRTPGGAGVAMFVLLLALAMVVVAVIVSTGAWLYALDGWG